VKIATVAAALVLFASPAFAQSVLTNSAVAPGCGAEGAKFDVTTVDNRQSPGQPDKGKALVYFVEDDTEFGSSPKPTTRAGLDGKWVGATHGNSYFSFSIDPGEHHLCASWQRAVIVRQGLKTAAAHFSTQAGSIYYFRVKNTWTLDLGVAGISLEPLDNDEGRVLVKQFSLSSFRPKT
jgi:Protein of unknown function (DUF2846)